ncbi:hypothetical protein CYMTET_17928 [Cymbomonas tetramitiformis]|uniref:Uncharacterized protein n=1 Tax=Cymbomonas tetramitiformis TaxID=36881 RepID=A0AAE0L6G7_9CHLO|nr:hypothetical protein CYMTET_17928 [Cymbomonas tetramitiformis]
MFDDRQLIQEYINKSSRKLGREAAVIAKSIRYAVDDNFLVVDHTPQGSIFIDTNSEVYLVVGLANSIRWMLSRAPGASLPIGLRTCILGLGAQIAYDGIVIGGTEPSTLPQFDNWQETYEAARLWGRIRHRLDPKEAQRLQAAIEHSANLASSMAACALGMGGPGGPKSGQCGVGPMEENWFNSCVCVNHVWRPNPSLEGGEKIQLTDQVKLRISDVCPCGWSKKPFHQCHMLLPTMPLVVRDYDRDYKEDPGTSRPWVYSEMLPVTITFGVLDVEVVRSRLDGCKQLYSQFECDESVCWLLQGCSPCLFPPGGVLNFGDLELLLDGEPALKITGVSYQRMRAILKLLKDDLDLRSQLTGGEKELAGMRTVQMAKAGGGGTEMQASTEVHKKLDKFIGKLGKAIAVRAVRKSTGGATRARAKKLQRVLRWPTMRHVIRQAQRLIQLTTPGIWNRRGANERADTKGVGSYSEGVKRCETKAKEGDDEVKRRGERGERGGGEGE